jgi:PAT family beta-lactamase induction signal transducer AmpG
MDMGRKSFILQLAYQNWRINGNISISSFSLLSDFIMLTLTRKTLINTRLLSVLFLGFSSGLPFALIGSTLQAWFTETQVSLAAIGAISLVGIPYTLKFIWAPVMDYFSLPWLGLHRGWILISQIGLVVTLLVLANMNPVVDAKGMYVMAFVVAFLSASQDVAIDAYRIDVLHENERGLGAAYYIFTYRIATLVSGGLALICADYIGWKITYEIMAIIQLIAIILTCKAPRVLEVKRVSKDIFKMIAAALADLFQRKKIVFLLLFLMFYKFGDALALQLMTNFLLHGLGFTLTEIGLAYKIVSLVATVSGAFVGGIILTRWPIYRALLWFGVVQALSNLMFVILTLAKKQFLLMAASIFIENFCSGLSTAALLAFMMSLCNRHYTASQFALLSAITMLGRVFLGPVAAALVDNLGWTEFYIWSVILSFPGIIFLLLLRNEVSSYAITVAE